MTNGEIAKMKQISGYNCAQAVFCTFADKFGIDEKTAFKLSEAFGTGIGGMGDGTCGALLAVYMLAGLKFSSGGDTITKQKTYAEIQKLSEKFRNMNGAVLCNELKGAKTGKALRSCIGCVQDAVKLAEELLTDTADEAE